MAEKKGTTGKMFVWILLGLLILGLGGFGATNFSGGTRSIGAVGEAEISINDYSRALQNEMNAVQAQIGQPVTLQQAQAMGLTQRVLSQLVVTAALENEAKTLGISVGDERLADELRAVRAFQGPDGNFSRETYRLVLENANLSERDFENSLRAESASTLLQGAVLAGTEMPATYANTLLQYAAERRDVAWVTFNRSILNIGLPEATEAEQQAWYEENIAQFTRPETKQITYVWLTPDMITDTVEVDEEALRAAYEERSAQFNLPERRLVERLVFADEAAAQAAAEVLANGETTFDALVEARGLSLSDIDLGDVTLPDLGAAGDAVFAAEAGTIAGPAPSNLGPALFRINATLAAQTTTYEEALPDLRAELALDRARRVIEQQARSFDDELAGGATLEELAAATDLQLASLGWNDQAEGGIAGFEAFRDLAAQVTAEDYPAITDLGSGGVFAVRLDEITPPAPIPFDEVQPQVAAALEQQALTDALVAEAETRLEGAGGDLAALGLTIETEEQLTRTSFGADLPVGMLQRLFTLSDGETSVLAGDGVAYALKLAGISAADPSDETSAQMVSAFTDQAANAIANDLFRALSTDIQNRAGVTLDQATINAIHANFQ